jgi:hypothetical protein
MGERKVILDNKYELHGDGWIPLKNIPELGELRVIEDDLFVAVRELQKFDEPQLDPACYKYESEKWITKFVPYEIKK